MNVCTEAVTHRRISTQTLLHANTLTHRHFYTQTLFHTEAFTHIRFYTQTLLHTDPFTHTRFYTQTLLHTYAFTHGRFYTQTLLHTDAFTHRRFYTQTVLHTDTFTHRDVYMQTLTHTNAFTHRRFHKDFYTQTLTKRGTTGWPQLQTKVHKHSQLQWKKKKKIKIARDQAQYHSANGPRNGGPFPEGRSCSTHNPMQSICSLRYKISSVPWCRGWPQLQTKVRKHSRNGTVKKYKSAQAKARYHGIQKNLELRARMLWMIPQ